MNTHTSNKIFQNISLRVAKFRENRARNVDKSVLKKQVTRPKYSSLPLSLQRYSGDCKSNASHGRDGTGELQ